MDDMIGSIGFCLCLSWGEEFLDVVCVLVVVCGVVFVVVVECKCCVVVRQSRSLQVLFP